MLNTIATRWVALAPALCAVPCAHSPALALPAITGAKRGDFTPSAALVAGGAAVRSFPHFFVLFSSARILRPSGPEGARLFSFPLRGTRRRASARLAR